MNKQKMLFILYTSKTHGKESRPQKIRIKAVSNFEQRLNKKIWRNTALFCPFRCAQDYLVTRGGYFTTSEPFFIFKDQSPLRPHQARTVLWDILKRLNLNSKLYDLRSFRIGRAMDLLKYGATIEQVKLVSHWRSNVVYKYIKM